MLLPRLQLAALTITALASPLDLAAQCADGSPPPCPAPAARVAPRETRPPDPNRIAILPFRVTTTDTLLGEGFAELLATEFTGEGAPRAIDMATVLSAWRRAGGGLRTPLPRSKALEVARDLGAGIVSEGSIVGLGRQITVTTTLISVPSGAPRGSPTRVSASADSLDAILRQATTGLLAAVGGQQRSIQGARYTDSPQAMRLYLQGLSAWRRGRIVEAQAVLDKAIAEDSSFAQAVFRRYLVAVWRGGAGAYQRLAWDRRSRLAPQERAVLEGLLGANYPQPRATEQRHADRQRAANQLPDSPDALYLSGDYWYHYGGTIDATNQLTRARDLLVRAAALDSQATVLRHLLELGFRLRDTALIRQIMPSYLQTDDGGRWQAAWLAGASLGDPTLLAQGRRLAEPRGGGEEGWVMGSAMMAHVSLAAFDELFTRWESLIPQDARPGFNGFLGMMLVARGRPGAAERRWASIPPLNPSVRQVDLARIRLDLADESEGLDVQSSASRLTAIKPDSLPRQDACLVALWRLRRGDSSAVERNGYGDTACDALIKLTRMPKASAATLTLLAHADSVLRNSLTTHTNIYEGYLLARAWESNGKPDRALGAVRYRIPGFGNAEAPWTLPYEGRLAAMVGDTATAIQVYRYWLDITADAEPIIVPKRDSVRAELLRLTRRLTP